MQPTSPPSGGTLATAFFGDLEKGDSAPHWLVDVVANRWNVESARVELIAVSENASFRVSGGSGGETVGVLRLNRPGYLAGASAVASEAMWVRAIARDTPVRVAPPLVGVDGRFVQQFESPDGGVLTGLMSPYVEGRILEQIADPAPWFARIGRETALLHEHARVWTPPDGFERFDWELEHMLGERARWGTWRDMPLDRAQRTLLQRVNDAALDALHEHLAKSTATWGLIHADIRPSNVIVDADEMTIIDFDDCGNGWFWYDFASAMTWLDHRDDAPAIAQDWLRGYREVAPDFTTVDAKVAVSFDVVRCLTMLGWCTTHRADVLPEQVRGRVVETTCAVAERYLESPTWLLD